MRMALRFLPRRWRKSASDCSDLPEVQPRERCIAHGIEFERGPVPCDDTAVRRDLNLTGASVARELTRPNRTAS